MKIITRQTLANSTHQRWTNQYRHSTDPRFLKIDDELAALKDVTPDNVNAIIGNESWTNLHCNQCQQYVGAVVEVGEEQDYESSTAKLCFKCVNSVKSMVDSFSPASVDSNLPGENLTPAPKPWGQELGGDPEKWPVGRVVLVTGYDGQLFAGDLNARGYQEWWVTANGKILSDGKDRWMEWPTS